jgi:hypothetical protein
VRVRVCMRNLGAARAWGAPRTALWLTTQCCGSWLGRDPEIETCLGLSPGHETATWWWWWRRRRWRSVIQDCSLTRASKPKPEARVW